MNVSSRHHLRSDEIKAIADALREGLDVELDADSFELVELTDEPFDVVLVDGEPLVWYPEGEPFVTVRGANATTRGPVSSPSTRAPSFVSDGADVMRPGIGRGRRRHRGRRPRRHPGGVHGKALAIGRALTSGDEMVGSSGKVVAGESLHHVGDELYEFSV